jgi:hypothetical protein
MIDTTAEAERVRVAGIRRMSPSDRVAHVLEWSESIREMQVARLRELHPDWTQLEAVEHMLGVTLIPIGHAARRA